MRQGGWARSRQLSCLSRVVYRTRDSRGGSRDETTTEWAATDGQDTSQQDDWLSGTRQSSPIVQKMQAGQDMNDHWPCITHGLTCKFECPYLRHKSRFPPTGFGGVGSKGPPRSCLLSKPPLLFFSFSLRVPLSVHISPLPAVISTLATLVSR